VFSVLYNVPVLAAFTLVLSCSWESLGTFVTEALSAISAQARIRDLAGLPAASLALLTPVLIASTEATAALLVPESCQRWDCWVSCWRSTALFDGFMAFGKSYLGIAVHASGFVMGVLD